MAAREIVLVLGAKEAALPNSGIILVLGAMSLFGDSNGSEALPTPCSLQALNPAQQRTD
jgi:hypothetical protein